MILIPFLKGFKNYEFRNVITLFGTMVEKTLIKSYFVKGHWINLQ